MPLVAATLQGALAPIFAPGAQPHTPDEAALRWAQAIGTYAATAQSPTGGLATNVAASVPGLQSALASAFGNPRAQAAQTAQAIGSALVAFWTPVLFAGAAVGTVVTAAAVGPAAQASLTTAWAALAVSRASASDAAQQIAAAIDAACHLVVVLDTFPPPVPPVVGPVL